MDYSKFVNAILEDDTPEINRQVKVITAVLIKFLTVRMDAPFEDAQDCAQNTLIIAINKIKNDELNHPDAIINYLFTTSKHEYFKVLSKEREVNYEELPEHEYNTPDQLSRLVNNEKMTLLKRCIEALKEDYKKFIEYWFENPGYETAVVADHFGITVGNAWTKKHRVINVLKECLEKKFQI